MRKLVILIWWLVILAGGCTTEFSPENDAGQDLLVVEGILTNEDKSHSVRLFTSTPLGKPLIKKPVTGALVTITDENGVVSFLPESTDGIYTTDSASFRTRTGGYYSLGISVGGETYSTDPILLRPVPPINSLYYEKEVITASEDSTEIDEGCSIYLDTGDPTGECRHFRWEFTETWEYVIPYAVANKVCWVTAESDKVLIRNTSSLSQSKVTRLPVTFISNKTDRLKETYSIQTRQYSLSEEEFVFWEMVKKISQNTGGLYDAVPAAIPGNIYCTSHPGKIVLGWFSVSAVTTKRLFIDEVFLGLPHFYTYCATDTLGGSLPETGLNSEFWVIEDFSDEVPPFWVVTTYKECADCSTRGTNIMPPFWVEYLNSRK